MAEDMKSLGDLETVSTSSEAIVETTIVREPKRDDFGRSMLPVEKRRNCQSLDKTRFW